MKLSYILWMIPLMLTVYSCKSDRTASMIYQSVDSIRFQLPVDTTSLAERIGRVEYITLETPKNAFIYEADKIEQDENRIYVADLRGDKIVAYDRNGRYLNCLDKKGNGPGEYLEIRSFTIDGKNLYIIDNYQHKVLAYDCSDFQFQWAKDLPIVADDIASLYGGKFLLGLMPMAKRNMPHSNHLLFVVNSDFEIISRLLPYPHKTHVPFAPLSFFNSDKDNVYFSSLLFDGFTIIPRTQPDSLHHVAIDFDNPIPDEIREDGDKIDKGKYQYLCTTPINCGTYWAFQALVDDYIQTFVYDRQKKLLMGVSETQAPHILYYPTASWKNQFITYLADTDIYEDLLRMGFPKADTDTEQALYKEGAVLLLYTMN